MEPTASGDGLRPTASEVGLRPTASGDGGHGLEKLASAGVSTWLDGVSRPLLRSGRLQELVAAGAVTGTTTTPEAFAEAVTAAGPYAGDLERLARAGGSPEEIVLTLLAEDARFACDVLAPVHEATGGRDGWAAFPLDPRLAHDSDATLVAARTLRALVDRPNVLVSVPATQQGVPAIRDAIAEGISVNAASVYSPDRFRAVQAAYVEGLERVEYAGVDLRAIASFASLPLGPLDAAMDAILDVVKRERAGALRSRLAIAHAVLAYEAFENRLALPRWRDLAGAGAHPQRPVWTHTAVTGRPFPPTRYVVELVAPGAVAALTEVVLQEVAEHAVIDGDAIHSLYGAAQAVLDDAERVGISFQDVAADVEELQLAESVQAWEGLLGRIRAARPA